MSYAWVPGQAVLLVVLTGLVVVSGMASVGSPAVAGQHPASQSGPDATASGERLNSSASSGSSYTFDSGWNTGRANPANTNYINTTGPTNPITTRWTFPTEANTFSAGPLVVNGTVYFGTRHYQDNEGTLYAVDAWTGEERWTFQAPTRKNPESIAVLRDTVYVGSRNGRVYALDTTTGDQFWEFETDGRPTDLTVANRTLYVTSYGTVGGLRNPDGQVYALGALRGEEKWAFRTEGPARGAAVKDGTVYVSARYGNVYSLDGETGDVIWNVVVGDGERKHPPSVANGIVYVGGAHSNVYGLDAETGNQRWRRHSQEAGRIASPSVLGDTAYFTGSSLHAVNAKTGADRWTVSRPRGTPVLLNNIGYVHTGGTLYTLNPATGNNHARFTTDKQNTRFHSAMAVLNGSLYAGVGIDEPRTQYRSDHTAFYALGTPEFNYSDLSVTPQSPDINESVKVTATVRNMGTGPGEFNATLAVNGNVTNTTTARLDPRTSRTVTFAHTFPENGTYTVEIGGLTRRMTVGDIEPAPTPTPTPAGDADSPTPTEPPGETATAAGSDSTPAATPTATSGTAPGFGVGGWVAAVALVAVLVGIHKRD